MRMWSMMGSMTGYSQDACDCSFWGLRRYLERIGGPPKYPVILVAIVSTGYCLGILVCIARPCWARRRPRRSARQDHKRPRKINTAKSKIDNPEENALLAPSLPLLHRQGPLGPLGPYSSSSAALASELESSESAAARSFLSCLLRSSPNAVKNPVAASPTWACSWASWVVERGKEALD